MLNNQDFAHNRSKSLGGSDIGAILGLSKFRTPLDVWLEKTGQAQTQPDHIALRFGSFAESFIADEYSLLTQSKLSDEDLFLSHPEHTFCTGHIDRWINQRDRILECKTANPYALSEWGDLGSDQVPMSYLVQCQWYLMLSQCPSADLAVLIGNSDFRIYHIAYDEELGALLLDRACQFWQDHVLTQTPPSPSNLDDLKYLYPKATLGKTCEASHDIYEEAKQLWQTHQQIKTLESASEQLKQHLMQYMSDAEILTYQGQTLCTWKTPKASSRFQTQAFAKDHPDLYQQYQQATDSTRRFLMKEPS